MSKKTFILVLALALVALGAYFLIKNRPVSPASQETYSYPPKFKDYPATGSFSGSPAAPNFASMPEAREFRTQIAEQSKTGPNFAGYYTMISWGCGTACQSHAIVDAETGKITVFGNELVTTRDMQFRKDSRLLIFDPPQAGIMDSKVHTRYFVLENGNLRQIER